MRAHSERVRLLRAKADSTTFPAEAQALRAKADELEAKCPEDVWPDVGGYVGGYETWSPETRTAFDEAMRNATMRITVRLGDLIGSLDIFSDVRVQHPKGTWGG